MKRSPLGTHVALADGKCSICNNDFVAQWEGPPGTMKAIAVCTYCARTALPMLMADALVEPNDLYCSARKVLKEIEGPFWRAVAANAPKSTEQLDVAKYLRDAVFED